MLSVRHPSFLCSTSPCLNILFAEIAEPFWNKAFQVQKLSFFFRLRKITCVEINEGPTSLYLLNNTADSQNVNVAQTRILMASYFSFKTTTLINFNPLVGHIILTNWGRLTNPSMVDLSVTAFTKCKQPTQKDDGFLGSVILLNLLPAFVNNATVF